MTAANRKLAKSDFKTVEGICRDALIEQPCVGVALMPSPDTDEVALVRFMFPPHVDGAHAYRDAGEILHKKLEPGLKQAGYDIHFNAHRYAPHDQLPETDGEHEIAYLAVYKSGPLPLRTTLQPHRKPLLSRVPHHPIHVYRRLAGLPAPRS